MVAAFAGVAVLLPAPPVSDWSSPAFPIKAAIGLAQPPPAEPNVYGGLGTWVDVYDLPYLHSPAHLAQIKRRGIRTIYIETASAGSAKTVHRGQLGKFLERAHDAELKVVAWTLPGHTKPPDDRRKAVAALTFRSPHGDRFDGFALDIESTSVRDLRVRNKRMLALSRRIKRAAGDMPLGAITYPPTSIDHPWSHFPWKKVARLYDAFLPMAYATYHHDGEIGVRNYTARNVKLLRGWTRDDVPIHMIGGLAGGMSPTATRGFADAVLESQIAGGSLYDFRTTSEKNWRHLEALR